MKKWIALLIFVFTFSLGGCDATSDDSDDTEGDTATVYFNVYGGSVVDSITIEKGGTISPPIEPLRTGYTFDGWFYDTDYLIPFNFDAPINSNTQVHAKWIDSNSNTDTVTITFNTNGGSSLNPITGNTGDPFTLPTPARANYTFDGWYTNSSLTVPFGGTVIPNADITLYAKWIENTSPTETATITFNTNGGSSISPLTGNVGDAVSLPTPSKSGHTFDGWFTNSALTTAFTGSTIPNTDITLYAKWIENTTTPDTATITFNTNGGSSISPITGTVGDTFNLPTPTRIDHTFDGWYIDSNLTLPFTDATIIPNNDITLYAKWTENISTPETVTITFNTNGGSSVSSITLTVGDTYWPPAQPTRTDYDFVGWYLNANFTSPLLSTTTFTEDTTLYAKWTETVSVVSDVVTMLENDWGFTCNNNICTYQEGSYLVYTLNFNTLTFTKELTDNSTSGDEQTKHEIVVMDENWNVSYSIDIVYLGSQTASMSVSGNGLTDTYNVTSFSSNYLSESNVYDDAVQFIDGPYGAGLVGMIEIILNELDITMDDLK